MAEREFPIERGPAAGAGANRTHLFFYGGDPVHVTPTLRRPRHAAVRSIHRLFSGRTHQPVPAARLVRPQPIRTSNDRTWHFPARLGPSWRSCFCLELARWHEPLRDDQHIAGPGWRGSPRSAGSVRYAPAQPWSFGSTRYSAEHDLHRELIHLARSHARGSPPPL